MAAWEPQNVRTIFAGLVPEKVAAAYEKLLDADGVLEEDAVDYLDGYDVKATLLRLGMATVYPATPSSPPMVDPVDPELALQGVLNNLQAQATDLQRSLTEGTRRAIAAHSVHRASGNGGSRLAEILTDRNKIQRMSGAVVNDARRDFMELDNIHRDSPLSEAMMIGPLESLGGRVTHRVIQDEALVQDPVGRRFIRACMAAGQQIRWRPRVHTKMQIADTNTALVAFTRTGMSGALLFHSEPVISALREYFELLWETSIPVSGPLPAASGPPLTSDQREILDLLDIGLSQERIAERLDKSPKTVQRQIAALYQMLGVKTAYQAGAAAVRKGWIS